MPWNTTLRRPLHLTDGRVIRTLADARTMILTLPEHDQRRPRWQSLAALLVSAADAGHPSLTAIVTNMLQRALSEPPFTSAPSVMRRGPRVRKQG